MQYQACSDGGNADAIVILDIEPGFVVLDRKLNDPFSIAPNVDLAAIRQGNIADGNAPRIPGGQF